ncbi:MAG: DUF975 family protein [Clostridia bacterium]|nr:DUF975 family protein [Clostridia bacterium]
MFNRREIKERAKQQLGNSIFANNWLFALVVILISGAISAVAGTAGILAVLVTGPLAYGVAFLFLKQARDGQKMVITDVFKGFTDDFGGNVVLILLETIFVALWTMLFIIPGIVKAYSYSMIFYIKADHPEYDWHQCFDESKRITSGHKWDLFVLDLSFIGWLIVGSICLGVGNLWVSAYMTAAKAQAYEAIKNAQ